MERGRGKWILGEKKREREKRRKGEKNEKGKKSTTEGLESATFQESHVP